MLLTPRWNKSLGPGPSLHTARVGGHGEPSWKAVYTGLLPSESTDVDFRTESEGDSRWTPVRVPGQGQAAAKGPAEGGTGNVTPAGNDPPNPGKRVLATGGLHCM